MDYINSHKNKHTSTRFLSRGVPVWINTFYVWIKKKKKSTLETEHINQNRPWAVFCAGKSIGKKKNWIEKTVSRDPVYEYKCWYNNKKKKSRNCKLTMLLLFNWTVINGSNDPTPYIVCMYMFCFHAPFETIFHKLYHGGGNYQYHMQLHNADFEKMYINNESPTGVDKLYNVCYE